MEEKINNNTQDIEALTIKIEQLQTQYSELLSSQSRPFVLTYPPTLQDIKVIKEVAGSSTSKVYSGSVSSTGTSIILPSGWTCSRTSVGLYMVIHNLNTVSYTVLSQASAIGNPPVVIQSLPSGFNSFYIQVLQNGSSLDSAFTFILSIS